eukprot:TRINITY_DN6591_c0_g1_i6.p1 TRINITY_DN6591_c0_g1~~TRINITY_DN6591_c0_g1_i6.p1  ORF type:complete len:376 (-),score=57.10 TRINITY_DN6591_c0_g1_i6:899-2026(-)
MPRPGMSGNGTWIPDQASEIESCADDAPGAACVWSVVLPPEPPTSESTGSFADPSGTAGSNQLASCTDQQACTGWTVEPVQISGVWAYEVCLTLDFNAGGCNKPQEPTEAPTEAPTQAPTETPTEAPTTQPPTTQPSSEAPTEAPTNTPSCPHEPSSAPSPGPTSTDPPIPCEDGFETAIEVDSGALVQTGGRQCQTGPPGSKLQFLLMDGVGCAANDAEIGHTQVAFAIGHAQAECMPRPGMSGNGTWIPDQASEIESCADDAPGAACVWSVVLPPEPPTSESTGSFADPSGTAGSNQLASCTDQQACTGWTVEPVQISGVWAYEVCLTLDFNAGGCNKPQDTSPDTISLAVSDRTPWLQATVPSHGWCRLRCQ